MKRIIAIAAELIPVLSAALSWVLILSGSDSELLRQLIQISVALAFLGFAFFFLGRKLAKEDRTVRIIGLLDWAATLSIVLLYVLAIFSFGL